MHWDAYSAHHAHQDGKMQIRLLLDFTLLAASVQQLQQRQTIQ